ncbi:MAG: serine hydrolase domain-containing protein [Gemmatimonadota bacterium]
MKKNRFLVISSFLLICLTSAPMFAQEEASVPASIDELKQSVAEIIDRYDVPAVGIAMVDQSGPVWIGALGKANIEQNRDADENTLFRIASTSKIFVALSVLKLVEEGKLNLSDKLADLAPEIAFKNRWEAGNPIRVVHLLEHTTGWDETHYPELAHNDPTPATLREGLDFHPHSRQSRWQPGTRFSYSNSGPSVAAYIVEKISGRIFEDYVQENFFDPLGMTSATFFLSAAFERRGATLYERGDRPLDYSHLIMRPAGSINASPHDMAQLIQFFLDRGKVNGNAIISEISVDRMERVESTSGAKAGQELGYGPNNYSSIHKQWVYREHNGGFDGAMAEFAYLPEANAGHAIMINSKHPLAFRKLSRLIRDYETRNLPDKVIEPEQTVTDQHREIAGLYLPIAPRMQKLAVLFQSLNVQRFGFEGDALAQTGLLGGRPDYFYPVSTSLYRSKNTGLIALSKVVDPLAGDVIHIAGKNGVGGNLVLRKVPSWIVYPLLVISLLWVVVIFSSVAYFLVWSIRRLLGRIPAGATIRVRLWPLLATMSIVLTIVLMRLASSDFHGYLGRPTGLSVGVMLTTIAFAVFSLLAVITVYRERRTPMNRANYWYSAGSSVVHLVMAIYLMKFGAIGIMFWS